MRKKDTAVILLLLVTVLFFFSRILDPHTVFLGADLSIFFPIREFLFNSVKNGILPLWNPYFFCGAPSASNATMFGMFYPLNMLFLFMPLNPAFNYTTVGHVFLAGVFMYYFVKGLGIDRFSSFVSSIVFMFGGSFVALLVSGTVDLLYGISWIPLILHLAREAFKKNDFHLSLLAGVTVGMQGLGGHPQVWLMTVYALFLYFLYTVSADYFEKPTDYGRIGNLITLFVVILAVGIGLYAIQLFPSMEAFLNHSRRSLNMDYQFVSSYSMPLKQLFSFLAPNLFGNPIEGHYWGAHHFEEVCRYVGIFPLALAAIAVLFVRDKEIKFFFCLLIISVLTALGSYGPVYKLFYTLLPGFRTFRCPVRWLFLSVFSISILAGFGLSFLATRSKRKRDAGILIKGLVSLNASVIVLFYLCRIMKIDPVDWLANWTAISVFSKEIEFQFRLLVVRENLFNFILLSNAVTLNVAAFLKYKAGLLLPKILTVVIILFDLWFFGQRFIIPVDNELYLAHKQWEYFSLDHGFYRVLVEPPIYDYSSVANRVFSIGGESGLELKDYSLFRNEVFDSPRILNAKYILTGRAIDDRNAELVRKDDIFIFDPFDFRRFNLYESPVNIYRYDDFLPRAFIVHKIVTAQDEGNVFRLMNGLGVAGLRDTAVMGGEGFFLDFPAGSEDSAGEFAEITRYSPNSVKLETNLKHPGLLVLNETYFPGWQAYVDGRPEHIFKVNYIMRSVYLKEGRHIVQFFYRPLYFKIGAFISILTMVIVLSLLLNKGLILKKAITIGLRNYV